MSITNKIDRVRKLAQGALGQESEYAYLPDIIDILGEMSDAYKKGEFSKTYSITRGLLRIVTDNIDFMDSSLGQELQRLVDEVFDSLPTEPTPSAKPGPSTTSRTRR